MIIPTLMERRKFLTTITVLPLVSFKQKPLDKRIFYATIPVTYHGSWDGKTRYSFYKGKYP